MAQEPDDLVQRALQLLIGVNQPPSDDVVIEPAAKNPRPIYWQKADGSIVGPARPEFLARVGNGPKASFWVVALYEGQPVWVNSTALRSKRQFEQQAKQTVIELVREPMR